MQYTYITPPSEALISNKFNVTLLALFSLLEALRDSYSDASTKAGLTRSMVIVLISPFISIGMNGEYRTNFRNDHLPSSLLFTELLCLFHQIHCAIPSIFGQISLCDNLYQDSHLCCIGCSKSQCLSLVGNRNRQLVVLYLILYFQSISPLVSNHTYVARRAKLFLEVKNPIASLLSGIEPGTL